VRGFIERFVRGFFVVALQFDFQIFSDMDGFDAGVSQMFKGFQNSDALRVNDGFFGCDDDFGFHVRATVVSGFEFQVSSFEFCPRENFLKLRSSRIRALKFFVRCVIVGA
jgi:hypothetical protein